jgi:hypothetical protein
MESKPLSTQDKMLLDKIAENMDDKNKKITEVMKENGVVSKETVKALFTSPNGRPLTYAESRHLYG